VKCRLPRAPSTPCQPSTPCTPPPVGQLVRGRMHAPLRGSCASQKGCLRCSRPWRLGCTGACSKPAVPPHLLHPLRRMWSQPCGAWGAWAGSHLTFGWRRCRCEGGLSPHNEHRCMGGVQNTGPTPAGMHLRAHTLTHAHMLTHTHTHIYTYTYTYTHTRTRTHARTQTCARRSMHSH